MLLCCSGTSGPKKEDLRAAVDKSVSRCVDAQEVGIFIAAYWSCLKLVTHLL